MKQSDKIRKSRTQTQIFFRHVKTGKNYEARPGEEKRKRGRQHNGRALCALSDEHVQPI